MNRRSFLERAALLLTGGAAFAGGMSFSGRLATASVASTSSLLPPLADLTWWRDARFGVFIHWGPVALKGTEIGWSRGKEVPVDEYDTLYRRFNPAKFDARHWARFVRDAGAKYLVFTSKHHDGFCMWNTRLTDYNIMRSPFGRDVVKELARACRAEGIVFCLYHSICDWWHPDYPLGSPGGKARKPAPNMDRYNAYLRDQLRELLQDYGPIGILWFDGEWEKPWTEKRGVDLYRFCRQLQPAMLINNRVAKARESMRGTSRSGAFAGDYDTPEQRVGNFQRERPWESCITIAQQWAWKPDDKLKSLKECIGALVRTAGGDGNLLLNVGPTPEGEVEIRQVERMREIGRWLKRNGKTIYGSRGGPFLPGSWGASTCKGRTIYLHVLDPGARRLSLPSMSARILRASILHGGNLPLTPTSAGTTIEIPATRPDDLDTIVRIDLDRPAFGIAPVALL